MRYRKKKINEYKIWKIDRVVFFLYIYFFVTWKNNNINNKNSDKYTNKNGWHFDLYAWES